MEGFADSALPLGYAAIWSGKEPGTQTSFTLARGDALLPLSYFPHLCAQDGIEPTYFGDFQSPAPD